MCLCVFALQLWNNLSVTYTYTAELRNTFQQATFFYCFLSFSGAVIRVKAYGGLKKCCRQ
jgi:hypothetical protein